jgi:hypothetical protein
MIPPPSPAIGRLYYFTTPLSWLRRRVRIYSQAIRALADLVVEVVV